MNELPQPTYSGFSETTMTIQEWTNWTPNDKQWLFIDTRFDILPDHFMSSKDHIESLLAYVSHHGKILWVTSGWEISLKMKKPHCHIRIIVDPQRGETLGYKSPPKAYSQAFKNYIQNKTSYSLGLKTFMVKLTTPTERIRAFMMYPLKDYVTSEDIPHEYQYGFTTLQLDGLWSAARELRLKAQSQFEKFENKLNNDKTQWGKVVEYIDTACANDYNFIKLIKNEEETSDDSENDDITSNIDILQSIEIKMLEYAISYNDCKFSRTIIHKQALKYIAQKQIMTPAQIYTLL